jgi:ectoine hydroxylase-related dioxygenase (phytanoyl-CoA dioxygenase family)
MLPVAISYLLFLSFVFFHVSAANKPAFTDNFTVKQNNHDVLRKKGCEASVADVNRTTFMYTITPEQRKALRSSTDPKEFEEAFGELFIQIIRETFDKEGYVIIRGLFDEDLLQRLETASQVVVDRNANPQAREFVSLAFGPVFAGSDESDEAANELSAFYDTAVSSAIPQFIAKILLDVDQEASSLRVLKDAVMCKGKETGFCGWHVDDWIFWPTSAKSSPGVNAWIALDNIPSKFGGGLAISPGSHLADWRHDAYQAIGSTQIQPDGGVILDDSRSSEKGVLNTCKMADLAPELADRIEKSKFVFDFQKGDILFHTRWLFHRSEPVNSNGLAYFKNQLRKDVCLKRYSIRYELGSARVQRGVSIESSILINPDNGGKTLDEICEKDGPWYPRCSPEVNAAEMKELQKLVGENFHLVEAKKKEVFQKLLPYMKASK